MPRYVAQLPDNAVHPHECGEHTLKRAGVVVCHGSSPRVRGTFECQYQIGFNSRFIPTSAGNIC